ncbi:MAG: class I SAM-dependent methyltransferase [Candidatus Latescibacteria bacterium]|nr:class I SAM-dependent methyltransferase [Candidatus Latescibacterota bacterium]
MNWYRTAFGPHYRRLYAHRDGHEAAACVAAIAPWLPTRRGPVVDLGCGAGRHLSPLAAQGAWGLALDLSADLLAEAARVAGAVALPPVRADMRCLPLRDGSCAAVLSLFTSFGYFGNLDDHAPLLREIARVLAPGGRWCLDHLNAFAVRRELAAGDVVRERRLDACLVREQRRLGPGGRRVLKDVRIRPLGGANGQASADGVPPQGLDYTESVALFAPEELDALCRAAGLLRVAEFGGYDGRSFDAETAERWLLIYEREARP